MNFYKVDATKETSPNRKQDWRVSVDFIYGHNKDIVCKGGGMYAFWDNGKWNTNEYDLMSKIDKDISLKVQELKERYPESTVVGSYMSSNKSKLMKEFREYTKLSPQSEVQFNRRILFANETMKKSDYATTQLTYSPEDGPTPAYDDIVNVLYAPEEQEKILWFMGALLTNNMKSIQKFMYLYGGKGTGKGTIMKIFKMLFDGYWEPINLETLTSDSQFATGEVKETPLLIDDDTDLSNIKKDTNLLKLTAHEPLIVNTKYQRTYSMKFEGLLIAASNQRFKVRNIDSGITRRAIVVTPSNQTLSYSDYNSLMSRVKYEIPMIAQKAIDLFNKYGPDHYEDYIDYDMIEATDYFYSFVRENAMGLGDPCTLKRAAELYKLYVDDMGYESAGYKRKVKNELRRYYNTFYEAKKIDGVLMKNIFEGFKWDVVFPDKERIEDEDPEAIVEELLKQYNIIEQPSIFDEIAKDYPAQKANEAGVPPLKWESVTTTLSDISTNELHFALMPLQHIILDFDLKENGKKDLYKNLKAIKDFPPTYTELSKSGVGIHLHYIYDGDVDKLANQISDNIEILVFKGKKSLRRKLSKCNNLEIAHISSGLPLREEKPSMYKDIEFVKLTEKKMRTLIEGNLQRKYHKNTKPSIDFIAQVFEDAQKAGLKYDLRDMRQDILVFAMSSSNQSDACVKAVSKMKFYTIENQDAEIFQLNSKEVPKEQLTFFDIEVFPNLFIVAYKRYGGSEQIPTVLINPTPERVEQVLQGNLVGFNNRRYDNHIMYARSIGESIPSLYRQSQRIINRKDGGSGMYGGAYELSYTDIYDYCSAGNKKSLKKWEVELGIRHDELNFPWDKPVDEKDWERVAEYCANDVLATEAVFNATQSDYKARVILSHLSGLSINATTNQHTTRIVFKGDKNPEKELVYTDLSEMFPGYKFEFGKSTYRGLSLGEGGEVYSEPGVYEDVDLEDIESMHPNSIIQLNLFGKYTKNFKELVQARLAIKHKDIAAAEQMFEGKLKPFLSDPETMIDLANALKTAINSAYGLTKASFANPFKHPKNVDNIVAKRGALFMIDLRLAVQEKGYTVAHIKTDSIKIPNADLEIREFIHEFAKKYGYTFKHEARYKKLVLTNKAAYICQDEEGQWHATAKPFINPYTFKRLLTQEAIVKEDFFIVKEVKEGAIHMGEKFIGRFAEVYASKTGEELFQVKEDGKSYVSGTKGYLWKTSTQFENQKDVDLTYYEDEVQEALKTLAEVGGKEHITSVDDLFTKVI